jgi:glycerol uptake facilitator-like aquaporin
VTAPGRRLVAELVGTGLLVAVVVGSGIAVTRLTADGAVRVLVSAVVTALGLAVLILVFAPASGAHFNPVVTAADWALARRTPARYGPGLAVAVMGCQVAGAVGGAALADAMFAVPRLALSRTRRGGGPVLLDWDLPDPAGLPLEQVRPIRDQIRARVRELISQLSA